MDRLEEAFTKIYFQLPRCTLVIEFSSSLTEMTPLHLSVLRDVFGGFQRRPGPYLCIDFSQCLPKLFRLASQYHRLRATVSGWDLDRDSSFLQDLLQGITLGADDILVLGLLHLHSDGSSLLFL